MPLHRPLMLETDYKTEKYRKTHKTKRKGVAATKIKIKKNHK
jgi:hypothetical protein